MKILRIYTKLPPLKGGMENHIAQLTKFQIENGHVVSVFYNDGDPISMNDKKISIIKFYKIRPQLVGITLFYLIILLKLILARRKFDVIHIHGDWSSLLFLKSIKKLTSSKVIVFSIHGQLTKSFAHQKILPKLVKNVDLVFSTGYNTAKELEKLSDKEVNVQPSGIHEIFLDKLEKKFNKNKFSIITVANLLPKKNIEFIFGIARILKEYNFVVVGGGKEKDKLKKIVKDHNLENVELVGFKPPKEVNTLYQNSNCFLLTSFAEGTPTVILEAMACGLPIVTSNAGGISNIIKDYENGFVIEDFNLASYIEKLKLLRNNKGLIKSICRNNALLAQNYNWKSVAENITNKTKKKLYEKS